MLPCRHGVALHRPPAARLPYISGIAQCELAFSQPASGVKPPLVSPRPVPGVGSLGPRTGILFPERNLTSYTIRPSLQLGVGTGDLILSLAQASGKDHNLIWAVIQLFFTDPCRDIHIEVTNSLTARPVLAVIRESFRYRARKGC